MISKNLDKNIHMSSKETGPVLDANEWIKNSVLEVENMRPGQRREFIIPVEVDHLNFIISLGLPQRDYEIGGLFNTESRSMILSRGMGLEERGATDPGIESINPRRNEDASTDDIYFHTHPWSEKSNVGYFRDPKNACTPSDTDRNNVLSISMIEEEAGQSATVTSYISSGGFLTKTEATGANIIEEELLKAGISSSVIRAISEELAIVFPQSLERYAKDETSKQKLIKELEDFYLNKKKDVKTSFKESLQILKFKIQDLCRESSVRGIRMNDSTRLVESIETHFPKYLVKASLKRMGLNDEQIKIVHKMIGLTITKYKDTDTGLIEV